MATVRTILELTNIVSSAAVSVEHTRSASDRVQIVITSTGAPMKYIFSSADTVVLAQSLLRTAMEARPDPV